MNKTDELTAKEWLAGLTVITFIAVLFGHLVWYDRTKEWASAYWKTEIVRRGYGTWETTPDGQVWFKWKEPEAKPETWLHLNKDGSAEEESK